MRILWVKLGALWPLNTGGRIRTFNILQELSRQHRVTLLTTHAPDEDAGESARRLSFCEEVVSLPLAYGLAFHTQLGPVGIWAGLASGLACAAVLLARRFHRLTRLPATA